MRSSVLLLLISLVTAKLSCWETEDFEIVSSCKACKKNEEPSVCQHSGFIERVRCIESGKTEPRACEKLPKYQSQLFWRFECLVALAGAASAFYTFKRMRQLDYEHDERIKKQLSSL